MSYSLHQSNDFRQFIPFLAEEILRHGSIFQPAVLVVQNKALEHWLKEALSGHAGVCMALECHSQESVIPKLFSLVSAPAFDKKQLLSPEAMELRLFHLLGREDILRGPVFLPLRSYLSPSLKPGRAATLRRKQLAKQLTRLFSSYEKTRPDMTALWKTGGSFFVPPADPAPAEAWQRALWRLLYENSGAASSHELFECFAGRQPDLGKPLPWLGVFGSAFLLEEMEKGFVALAAHADVHRFWLNPSASFWGDLSSGRQQFRDPVPARGQTAGVHPMLENWGKLGRNQQRFFLDQEGLAETEHFSPALPETLLGRLQSGILTLELPEGPQNIAGEDDSLRIFSCVGKRREVEVLHDQLTALLSARADLCPGDIAVAAPQIEEYRGWIDAVFGSAGRARIPCQILSPKSPKESDFLGAVDLLMEVAASRFSPKIVFRLLSHPCFLKRHGLSPEDLETLRDWALKLPVKMCWNAAHREELGFPKDARHTWEDAFLRLALGFAMGPEENAPADWEGVFPFPAPVSSLEDASRLLCALRALGEDLRSLSAFTGSLEDWTGLFQQLLSDHLAARWEIPEDAEALLFLEKEFAVWRNLESCFREAPGALDFWAFGAFLKDKLESRPAGGKSASGALVFGSLRTLRAAPFKVLALLGMNEGVFPALEPKLSFDLRPHSPKPLDATQRDVDLYSFLETLVCAREKFWIFYSGKDPEHHLPLPPALPVRELLDFCRKSFRDENGLPVEKRILEEHPLHAFDARYFSAGSALFSFDAVALESARARARRRPGSVSGKRTPPETPPGAPSEVSAEALECFLKSPAQAFFRGALDLKIEAARPLSEGEEVWELDRRARFIFDREFLRLRPSASLLAPFVENFADALASSGGWPRGVYGERAGEALRERAERLSERIREVSLGAGCGPLRLEERALFVEMQGQAPLCITGVLPSFFERGFLSAVDSKAPGHKPHRNAWLHYLLLRSLDPSQRFDSMTSVVLSLHPEGKTSEKTFSLPHGEARRILKGLADAYLFNLGEATPLYFECCDAARKGRWDELPNAFEKALEYCEYGRLYFRTGPDFGDESVLRRLRDFTDLFYVSAFFQEKKR